METESRYKSKGLFFLVSIAFKRDLIYGEDNCSYSRYLMSSLGKNLGLKYILSRDLQILCEKCYLFILLQVSFNDTVRLNTKCSAVESLSTLK